MPGARTLAFAMPVVFALHVVEEAPWFVAWFNARVIPPMSPGSFLRVNAIALAITVGVALSLVASRKPLQALTGTAWIGFLMLANGLFHLVAALVDGSYCPGVITGVLLYLPFSLLFARATLRETHVPAVAVVTAALVGAAPMAIHGYVIVFRGSRLF